MLKINLNYILLKILKRFLTLNLKFYLSSYTVATDRFCYDLIKACIALDNSTAHNTSQLYYEYRMQVK